LPSAPVVAPATVAPAIGAPVPASVTVTVAVSPSLTCVGALSASSGSLPSV
jgi:hypothetical protein